MAVADDERDDIQEQQPDEREHFARSGEARNTTAFRPDECQTGPRSPRGSAPPTTWRMSPKIGDCAASDAIYERPDDVSATPALGTRLTLQYLILPPFDSGGFPTAVGEICTRNFHFHSGRLTLKRQHGGFV